MSAGRVIVGLRAVLAVVAMAVAVVVALSAWGTVAAAPATAPATGRTPLPVVEPAKAGTQCVEVPATMRRSHMDFLKHQRDDTVHKGIRGAKHSLKGCVDCHASRQTGSVAAAPGDFCVSCHSYTAVKIDCFECHTGKAQAAAKGPTQ